MFLLSIVLLTACSTPRTTDQDQQEASEAPTQEEIEQDEEEFRSDLEESVEELDELNDL